MPGIEIELGDLTMGRAASSLVRWMLRQGRVDDAARLLGRPYAIAGVTASGDRRGRTLGFPTANLADGSWGGTLLPADGVYAGVATLPDGRERIAAISIGTKSTFGGTRRTCEAHLPGESLPLDWYGWPIGLAFTRWVRGQMRFAGPEAIAAQIARDLAAVTGQGAGDSAGQGAGVPA
jgi:riboflavin kinase/FMN adenylyltransferase